MSDGGGTVQALQDVHVKNVGNQSHAFVFVDRALIVDGDTERTTKAAP